MVIASIVILCKALDGATETIANRKALVTCINIYFFKTVVGYSCMGVAMYYVSLGVPDLAEQDPLSYYTNG